jgi:formiminoglutamase
VRTLPAPSNLFFSKNDPKDIRLGDLSKPIEPQQNIQPNSFYFLGYPDDEGIKLNGGRIGAAEAPNKIREYFYKMTPPNENPSQKIFDLGNTLTDIELPARHQMAKLIVNKIFSSNSFLISLGGGHDYGYPDTSAFVSHYKTMGIKPVVINLDAHLDVRPTINGFNSGTPFHRLLSEHQNDCYFLEVGIQPQCNSTDHREWAKQHQAFVFDLNQTQSENSLLSLFEKSPLKNLNDKTPCFVSFDIDAIISSEGGGCSQAWTTGLKFDHYLSFFKQLRQKFDVRGLGIYEVSPPLDIDNRTSKMAALAAYYFVFGDTL